MSEKEKVVVERSDLEQIFSGFVNDIIALRDEYGQTPSSTQLKFLNDVAVKYRLKAYAAYVNHDELKEYRELALAGELGEDEKENVLCEVRSFNYRNAPRGSCTGYAAVRGFAANQRG